MSEYPGYKYCFIDVETTGTAVKTNHIFQIAGRITDCNLNTLESFNFKFRPHSLDHVEQSALDKTRTTLENLNSLEMSSLDAYNAFIEICDRHVKKYNKHDKMHFVAYNAAFDVDFMREFFMLNGDSYFGSWFWNPPICVMQAAVWLTQRVRGALPNFQLATICKSAGLGWNEDAAHDAEYDIQMTADLFKYVNELHPKL